MTDFDIIDAAKELGFSFDVALDAVLLCSDDEERAYYAERGVRVLLESVERAGNTKAWPKRGNAR